MSENIKKITINNLLKADSFTQDYTVVDTLSADNDRKLIENNQVFFEHIYEGKQHYLTINGEKYFGRKIDQWMRNEVEESKNSLLLIVEGYAGCGKSTWVQSFLYNHFGNENYNYSYYNYDVGTHYSECDKINPIKEFILNGLIEQMANVLLTKDGEEIFKVFKDLTIHPRLKGLDVNRGLWMSFSNTESVNTSVEKLCRHPGNLESAKTDFFVSIYTQLQSEQFNTYRLLCLDYLWRLAQYIVNPNKYRNNLYVCYDNLDAIYNNNILCEFRDKLIIFRYNLSIFINALNSIKYCRFKIPPFVIFTTYRKITESRTRGSNLEMIDDTKKDKKFVKYIEISNLYNYQEIVRKRINHFRKKLGSDNIGGEMTDVLLSQMLDIEELLTVDFFSKGYSKLWNNNFRSCSNVLSRVIEKYDDDVQKCKDLIKAKSDGFNDTKSCYYGASSVFLNVICKVLCEEKIWDPDHLDLVNHTREVSAQKTSLSRLILTLLSNNENTSIPISYVFEKFEKVFDYKYICKVMGQMLTRAPDEIWRRPIYYSKNSFVNESQIFDDLLNQHCLSDKGEISSLVEFAICESGKTFIEKIVPHFEFYSARLTSMQPSLYCIDEYEDLETVLSTVFCQISNCASNQKDFINDYIDKYDIDIERYMQLDFHPKTNKKNSQLHIERIIFSHISYLNYYRLHLINGDSKEEKIEKTNKFNDIVLLYISQYLDLYFNHISNFSSERKQIAEKMKGKVDKAIKGEGTIRYISIDVD